jgi:diguanylate cyclase (GGDEF)-like protein
MRSRIPRFAISSALLAATVGLALLLAWKLGWSWLIQVLPSQPADVPWTAVSLCLGGTILLVSAAAGPESSRYVILCSRLLAATLAALGATVLLEYLAGRDGGIGGLLYASQLRELDLDTDGRPSPQSALSLVLFGAAAWLHAGRRRERLDMADIAVAASLFLPAAALLSYLFDIDRLGQAREGMSFGMPPLSALCMTLLAAGLASLHPGRGLASLLAARSEAEGGIHNRRMLLAAVLVPVFFGYLQVLAIRREVIDLSLGVAITVAASVMVFVVLLAWNAELVMRLYLQERRQLALREEQARREAATDALTLLYNRRGWEQCLAIEEQRNERENLDAGIYIIDLDGLKQLNDREGHASGDAMLQRAAQALRACVRRRDVVARIGGDEYAFLATDVSMEVAPVVEERLRKALQAVGVSASIGFALRSGHGSLPAAAEAADRAMYLDKRARKQTREQPLAVVQGGG